MARPIARQPGPGQIGLPQWIRPQLTELVDASPEGPEWLHEIKFDGYRMHARLGRGPVQLLTLTGVELYGRQRRSFRLSAAALA